MMNVSRLETLMLAGEGAEYNSKAAGVAGVKLLLY
jgi:hypothetical protein